MKGSSLALSALIVLSTQSIAAPEPLAPTGPWMASFADAQCVASRNYGSDKDPLYLTIKAPPIGGVVQIGVVRKGYTVTANQMRADIAFDDQPSTQSTLLEFGMRDEDQTALVANLSSAQVNSMRAASSMHIVSREADRPDIENGSRILQTNLSSADYRFKLTQILPLLGMLDQCTAKLRTTWNVEEGKAAPTLVRREPTGDLRGLFSPDDYPGIAVKKEQIGAIKIAILVDEKGKVADCTVIQTSGIASLDAQSCAVITHRAELKPAIGLDGKPAKGALVQKIQWMLED